MDTTTTLLGMSREEFSELVDKDVRGQAPRDLSAGLRAPEVADRWYHQLVFMKKNVESTLAAKGAEDKGQRLALLAAAEDADDPVVARDMRRRADLALQQFLRWRTGALRFRAGVEERLAEAGWRRRLAGSMVPTALLEERNVLLQKLDMLTKAIEEHKAAMADLDPDDIDTADEDLWSALSGGKRATTKS